MKKFLKKFLKTLLVFIISTIVIYMTLTIILLNARCEEYGFNLFSKKYYDVRNIDSEKIKELGNGIGNYEKLLEESLDESYYQEDSNYHTIAEYFDPLGYSIWVFFQTEITSITHMYIYISILIGASISVAYIVITSKRMNNILKLVIGYLLPMIIVPPIYMYTWQYRFWDILTTYKGTPIYFYIGYTIIFILMYLINYVVGRRMTKELNQAIKDK